jgi:hypothetical protein
MSDFEHEVPATDYGQWRREQHLAHMRASAETMTFSQQGRAGQT